MIESVFDREEAMFENAFGDALLEVDQSFLLPGERAELHRIMCTGWLQHAIIIFFASRWLSIHHEEPALKEFAACVFYLISREPSITSNRSTPLVVAIAHVLAAAAWNFRKYQLTIWKN